jgi:hypothetical protein
MSAHHAAQSVVLGQQDYARSTHLAKLFEDLTTAIIYARPADAAAFIAEEAGRMASAGAAYRAVPANGAVDTEEAAAAYMEEHRVRPLLEELFASLLVGKPADPFAFLATESRKLQELRAAQKPVRAAARARGGARALALRRTRSHRPFPRRPTTPFHKIESTLFRRRLARHVFSL